MLDAYFERIGYTGPRTPTLETLRGLTGAHVQSIPFENLDVLLGRPIELDVDSLFRKLVTERRGGYCFEQNGFLLHVLSELGFDVKPLSARVRYQKPRDFVPPRTHVLLQVEIEGESWLTDLGMGSTTLTSPIRWLEGEHPTAHEARRLLREGTLWFQQIRYGEEWHDLYEFTGEEMPLIDRILANWFTSAHPQSHFRNRLVVGRALPEGRRMSILNDQFTVRERDGRGDTRVLRSAEELLSVLADSFGLHLPGGTRFGDGPWPA